MGDWKGLEVNIIAFRCGEEFKSWLEVLDTDTMADVFEKYQPQAGWYIHVTPIPHEYRRGL